MRKVVPGGDNRAKSPKRRGEPETTPPAAPSSWRQPSPEGVENAIMQEAG